VLTKAARLQRRLGCRLAGEEELELIIDHRAPDEADPSAFEGCLIEPTIPHSRRKPQAFDAR
jgi:hypothetical protein